MLVVANATKNNQILFSFHRFVQFFISPKFDAEYMEKELNAVQSEYELNFDSDCIKVWAVNSETCDQSHACAKFNYGNRKTLKEDPEAQGIDVRERLLEFYSEHYSANVMCLCVLGKDSLDELQAMIERLPFDQIENKKIDVELRSGMLASKPFRMEHLAKQIKIVPKRDTDELRIEFSPFELFQSLSLKDKWYMVSAENYLSKLFNQKHDGSILTELKDRRSLVESINCYASWIHVQLVKDGINTEKIDEIVNAVFQYLNFAKRDGIQSWIYEEENTTREIALNNKEKEPSLSTVLAIASRMHILQTQWVVVESGYLDPEFRPVFIERFLDNLKPARMRILLMSKAFEGQTDRKDKHYGVDYSYEDIGQERIDRWNDAGFNENFELHQPNEYLPANFELVECEKEKHRIPQLIKQDRFSNVWFLQDNQFKKPRAFYGIQLANPFLQSDPAAHTLMRIYCALLKESLKEHFFLACQAGIHCAIALSDKGAIMIRLDGYSDKLCIVLSKIMDRLIEFEPSRERFEKIKENEIRLCENKYKLSLNLVLSEYWRLLFCQKYHSSEILLDCMDQVTFEELESVRRRFYSRLFINLLVHGNVTRMDADRVESMTIKRLIKVYGTSFAPKALFPIWRCLKLDDNAFYIYQRDSKEHHHNAILSIFQVGLVETLGEFVKAYLLVLLLKSHFFNRLRTEEQLGYDVLLMNRRMCKVEGILFQIQSSHDVQYLDERIEQFIEWSADHLNRLLSDEEFNSHKSGLKAIYSEPIRSQTEQSFDFWDQIIGETLNFDENKAILEALEGVGKQDVVDVFNEHLVKNRRKLSIRITGMKKVAEEKRTQAEVDLNVAAENEQNGPGEAEIVDTIESGVALDKPLVDRAGDGLPKVGLAKLVGFEFIS